MPRSYPFSLWIVAAVLLVALPSAALADWVRLKEGGQFHGKILVKTDRYVVLKTSKGSLTFKRQQIDAMHESRPGDDLEKRAEAKRLQKERERREAERHPDKGSEPPPIVVDSTDAPPLTAPKVELVRRALDHCAISLPKGFLHQQKQKTYAGYKGRLEGLFHDPQLGAYASVSSTAEMPAGAASLAELRQRLAEVYEAAPAITVHSLKLRQLGKRKALVADMTSVKRARKTRNLQAWTRTSGGTLYSISLSVPEPEFQRAESAYWSMLESLEIND